MTQTLRRLLDLPGVADLESKALMKPGYADPSRRDEFPEVDEVLLALFGLTAEQAEDAARPDDWDGIERLSPQDQADLFEAEVRYLMQNEWARFPDDILWRRSKLGLTMPPADRDALAAFMTTVGSESRVASA